MRQHRPRHEVSDRKNMRHIGAHLFVDLNHTAVIDNDASLIGIKLVTIGTSSNGDEHPVINANL